MPRARRRLTRWATTGMVLCGAVLVVQPVVDELRGEWHQQEFATSTDASVSRYRNAVAGAYDVATSDFEDALVSFEIGAVPTTADGGRLVAHGDVPTPAASGVFAGSGEPSATLPADSPSPGVHVLQATPDAAPTVRPIHQPAVAAPVFTGAIISIPKIGLNQAVVEGVSRGDLKNGPGHYPGTAVPGYSGNTVISGHRTTYTQPFYDLDLLIAGDEVILDTSAGSFRYLVESSHVVSPDDVGPLAATSRPILTLTTCTPKGSADRRLIVVAVLDGVPRDQAS